MTSKLLSKLRWLSATCLIFLFFSFSNVKLQAQIDPTLTGKWSGIVTENGFFSYPVIMVLDSLVSGQIAGSINYPEIPCSGNLTFNGNNWNVHLFTEIITKDPANCIDSGRVEITRISHDSIQWDWFYKGGTVAITSGILTRMKPDSFFIGVWCGTVFQPGFGSFETIMTINEMEANQISGGTVYPPLACLGDNVFYGNVDSSHYFFETITVGLTNCIDGTIVLKKLSQDSLQFNWFSGAITDVTGTLGRKSTSIGDLDSESQQFFTLSDIYPNPSSGQTQFKLEISQAQNIKISLYDLLGREIQPVFEGKMAPAQNHLVKIEGGAIPNGTYIIDISGEYFHVAKKVIFSR